MIDRVTDILREEAARRYSAPWPPLRMETMGDFADWLLVEGEHQARFHERLRMAQVDEAMDEMRRKHQAEADDAEIARLCEAEVYPS